MIRWALEENKPALSYSEYSIKYHISHIILIYKDKDSYKIVYIVFFLSKKYTTYREGAAHETSRTP